MLQHAHALIQVSTEMQCMIGQKKMGGGHVELWVEQVTGNIQIYANCNKPLMFWLFPNYSCHLILRYGKYKTVHMFAKL